ncbi:hypothetical protein D3C85_1537010 [compost metagenome]
MSLFLSALRNLRSTVLWPRRSLGACARRPHGNTSSHSSQPTGRIGKLRSAAEKAISILCTLLCTDHASSGWSDTGRPWSS